MAAVLITALAVVIAALIGSVGQAFVATRQIKTASFTRSEQREQALLARIDEMAKENETYYARLRDCEQHVRELSEQLYERTIAHRQLSRKLDEIVAERDALKAREAKRNEQ